MTYIGNRFNFGNDINSNLKPFPALYLAINKETSLQEVLGQEIFLKNNKINILEHALTKSDSITTISISGKLERVFDLRNSKNLVDFVKLIKDFKFSPALIKLAKRLGLKNQSIVSKPEELFKTIMEPNWRELVTLLDDPSNSQIFGQLVQEAGISGILYLSKISKKECLAIFPDNFEGSNSYINFDDAAPEVWIPSRLDSKNYKVVYLNPDEVKNFSHN